MQYVTVLAIIAYCTGMHTCAYTAHTTIIRPFILTNIAHVTILSCPWMYVDASSFNTHKCAFTSV